MTLTQHCKHRLDKTAHYAGLSFYFQSDYVTVQIGYVITLHQNIHVIFLLYPQIGPSQFIKSPKLQHPSATRSAFGKQANALLSDTSAVFPLVCKNLSHKHRPFKTPPALNRIV